MSEEPTVDLWGLSWVGIRAGLVALLVGGVLWAGVVWLSARAGWYLPLEFVVPVVVGYATAKGTARRLLLHDGLSPNRSETYAEHVASTLTVIVVVWFAIRYGTDQPSYWDTP
jgi:hypothetical protein